MGGKSARWLRLDSFMNERHTRRTWLDKVQPGLRERINLRIMRAVAARGLSFAFPTQTLHVEDDVARKLAGAKPAVLG